MPPTRPAPVILVHTRAVLGTAGENKAGHALCSSAEAEMEENVPRNEKTFPYGERKAADRGKGPGGRRQGPWREGRTWPSRGALATPPTSLGWEADRPEGA